VNEQAVCVGHQPQLVGVYTSSDCCESQPSLPVILLVNSGLLPHVGPFRLYVKLAREFSELGFNTFRFDLSGIGDSERQVDMHDHDERNMRDIGAVMDFLEAHYNIDRFIVMGICTGADNAHKAMVLDPRVVGAVSIDGYAYPTAKYYFNLYAPKLIRLSSWITLAKKALTKATDFFSETQQQSLQTFEYEFVTPTKRQVESDYRKFIERNVNLLCIYTASWPYNYKQQLADSFTQLDFGTNIQSAYLENAEHIFPLKEDRQNLTDTITEWLNSRFVLDESS